MEARDDSAGSEPCPIRITSCAEVTVQGGQPKTYDAIKAPHKCVHQVMPGLHVVPPTGRQQNASLVAVVIPKRRRDLGWKNQRSIRPSCGDIRSYTYKYFYIFITNHGHQQGGGSISQYFTYDLNIIYIYIIQHFVSM